MTKRGILEVPMHSAATPETVFPYFTDPARYVAWMGRDATLEPAPDGLYCVQMGDGFGISGTFLEVDPPHRLVFTWGWAQGAGRRVLSEPQHDDALRPGSTRVVVTLDEDDGGARLTLRHHDLPTGELRDGHRIAWETYLDRLATLLAGDDPGPDPHAWRNHYCFQPGGRGWPRRSGWVIPREGADMTDAITPPREGADMTDAITPPSEGAAVLDSDADYRAVVLFDAPPEAAFDALTTVAGLAGWWGPVSGSGSEGGELRFVFSDEDPLIIHVDMARRPSAVTWTVLECKFMPDWVGTMPSFELTPRGTGGCELRFRHQGLTPQLECFSTCKPGWDHYLSSLHDYVESGHGNPVGSGAAGAVERR